MSIGAQISLPDASLSRPERPRQAMDVGFPPRFLVRRMAPFVDRVLGATASLAGRPEHADPLVETIIRAIGERADRFRDGRDHNLVWSLPSVITSLGEGSYV
jgi:hypothetical protein